MRGIIYKYTNIINNKVYIGQTTNESKRRQKWNSSYPYAGNYINRARDKYGIESFKYEILYEINTEDEDLLKKNLNDLEIYYISLYNSKDCRYGYNLTDGGESGNGQIVTKETRLKISKSQKGRKKPMSEQGKLNISKAHKGPRPWMWKKVAQYDKNTETLIKVWDRMSDIIKFFGDKNCGNLIAAINKKNRHKTYRGYKWKYYGDNTRKEV